MTLAPFTTLVFKCPHYIPADEEESSKKYQRLSAQFLDSCECKCRSSEKFITCELLTTASDRLTFIEDGCISFSVDRRMLVEHFKYFQVMFEIGMRESQDDRIRLQDVELIDFLHIYHHTSKGSQFQCELCSFADNFMLFRLIDTSVYLQGNDVYQRSINILLKAICPQNSLNALLCGYKYSEKRLFSKALRFALYYASAIDRQQFDKCKGSHHSNIISFYLHHPMLNTQALEEPSDLQIEFPNIYTRIGLTKSKHIQSVPTKRIRVQIVPTETSRFRVQLIDDCGTPDDSAAILFDELLPHLDNPRGDKFIGYHYCSAGEKIYISGGEVGLGRGKWNDQIYEMDTIRRSVKVTGQMPERMRHHQSCCSEKSIYLAGGYDRLRCKRYAVHEVNLTSESTSRKLPSLPEVLDCLSVAPDGSQLYAKCANQVYTLKLTQDDSGWKMMSSTDDAVLNLPANLTDRAVKSLECPWYPDFDLPKFSPQLEKAEGFATS